MSEEMEPVFLKNIKGLVSRPNELGENKILPLNSVFICYDPDEIAAYTRPGDGTGRDIGGACIVMGPEEGQEELKRLEEERLKAAEKAKKQRLDSQRSTVARKEDEIKRLQTEHQAELAKLNNLEKTFKVSAPAKAKAKE